MSTLHTHTFKIFEYGYRSEELMVEEIDSSGQTRVRSTEQFFYGIVGHVRDRHGSAVDGWHQASQLRRRVQAAGRGRAGSQRWGMHCGGHYTHPGGPHTCNSRPAPQENAEVFTGEGVLWACWGNGEGSARVGPGLGQQ